MSESEAIEKIKKDICHGNPKGLCRDSCMYGKGECAYDMATDGLEEIQQYRAIGTVSEFRESKNFLEFLYNAINPNDMEQYLAMYHASEEKGE